MPDNGYWIVKLKAFAFDTEEEAKAFQDALLEALMAMQESNGVASSSSVNFVEDNDDD